MPSPSLNSALNEKSDNDKKLVDQIGNIDLNSLRIKNLNKIIIGHLNINSIRNKFDFLTHQVKGNIDILMISETKLDESFPVGQFLMDGYSVPYRLDRDRNGGGILLYIREDIPSKLLSINRNIEGFFVEINLRNKKKWLLSCSYNPKRAQMSNHLAEISKITDLYLTKYDQLFFLGDFNAGLEDISVKNFCSSYNLTSMNNKPTCFKNPDNPSCIDLILTNYSRSFQNSGVIECNRILDEHAPQKKRYLRSNQSPFMNKTLVKAIMVRSKLRNVFLKNKTEENRSNYSKQRNLCITFLRKSNTEYLGNLKEFWSVVKPLLSKKLSLMKK